MTPEKQSQVRDYLRTWLEEDWDDLLDQLALMPLPEALVAVHRRKSLEAGRSSPALENSAIEVAAPAERAATEQLDLI